MNKPDLDNNIKQPPAQSEGAVVTTRGSVVDIRFEERLPSINAVVKTGKDMDIILEVQMQLAINMFAVLL